MNCPHCFNLIDNRNIVSKNFFYFVHDKKISYNVETLHCANCNKPAYIHADFVFINFIIEFLCALELDDKDFIKQKSEIVLKYFREQIDKDKENGKFPNEIIKLEDLFLLLERIISNQQGELLIIINEFFKKFSDVLNTINNLNLFSTQFKIEKIFYNLPQKQIHVVENLEDYIKISNELKQKTYTWFRGLSNKKYKLRASIFRKQNSLDYESNKMINFMLRAPSFSHSCPLDEEHMKWLPFMQHYELPTRLLDWTDSPLCALFFALSSNNNEDDSIIYSFNAMDWNTTFHNINVIPIIDKNKDIFPTSKFASNAFIYNQDNVELYPLAVVPIRKYDRMYNQQANFTIHDCGIDMYELRPDMFTKMIIPLKFKQNIMKEMYNMGIDKTTYFPELTALAEVIKNFA